MLVVGGGNTGFQIAKELSATHKVVLSVGSKQKPLPQRIAGRDLFWWLTKTRSHPQDRRIAARARLGQRDTLIGSSPRELRRTYGVELKSRATDVAGRTARFEDGARWRLTRSSGRRATGPTTPGSNFRSSTPVDGRDTVAE